MGKILKTSPFLKVLVPVVLLAGVIVFMLFADGYADSKKNPALTGETVFGEFFVSGGPIVWFVLLPISIATVYLAAEFFLTIRRRRLIPADGAEEITDAMKTSNGEKLPIFLADKSDLLSTAVTRAVTRGGGDWFRMRNLVFESLEEQAMGLVRRIEWLRLIGNVSPMIGLFGTVLGMIKLFRAIVVAGGQPQPAQLAGGISVALVTTFWGLLIAIPALAVHGIFNNRIETFLSEAVAQAENIMPQMKKVIEMPQKRESAKPDIIEVQEKREQETSKSTVNNNNHDEN